MDEYDRDLEALASLSEPIRRALYDFVAGSVEPVSGDEAAEGLEISRQMAAYHLDRLADDGLLEVEFRRLSGRTGPGAGRPSKLYHRSNRVHEVSIPARRYELAARILLEAGPGGPSRHRGAHGSGKANRRGDRPGRPAHCLGGDRL